MNTVELSDSGHPQIANMSWIAYNYLVANVTIFFKWSTHNGHLSITEKFFKIRRCLLFRGFTILTRLRLDLSHLCEHTFKHSFQDCLIPLCLCGNRTKTSIYYLLHCLTYTNERLTLLNKIKSINCNILESSNTIVTKILLFGENTLSNSSNTLILNSTIEYIIYTQRFEGSTLTRV